MTLQFIRCVHMCTHISVVTLLRSNTYFDATIALKIGNRLAIIKKVKKIIHVLMLFNFIYKYISIYVAIWERSVALWESNVTNVVSMQRHIKLLMICITVKPVEE